MKSNHARNSETSSVRPKHVDSDSRSLKYVLMTTFSNWMDDDGPRLAAALAYYALFSLAPLLMIAMAIAGATLGRKSAEAGLEGQFYALVGTTGAQVIQGIIQDAHTPGAGTFTGIIGGALLVIGASALFVELQDGFNTIWHIEPVRNGIWGFLIERLLSFILVLATEVLLVISVLLTTAESLIGRVLPGELMTYRTLTRVTGAVVTLIITTFLFAMMFKFLPKARTKWRDIWPAAVVTALMFYVGKLLIAVYLRSNNLISAFGAANSVVVLVAWVYYTAMIFYFGAELAKVYARVYGVPRVAAPQLSRSHPMRAS